jgi:hypothetical protein
VLTAALVDSRLAQLAAIGFAATMVAVAVDLDDDRERTEAVSRTFDDLVDCRKGEARQINAELKQGGITREVAEQRMAQLRTLLQEDVTVAQGANAIQMARAEAFTVTVEEAKKKAPPPKAPEEAEKNQVEVKKAEAAIQTNQRVLAQQTASIEQAQKLAGGDGGFQLSLLLAPPMLGVLEGAA